VLGAPEVALLYPSERRVAYSSIAFHMLKGGLSREGVRVAAYFLEGGAVEAEKPSPPLGEARIIVVSLPYEIMYGDLVKALDAARIPVWARDRHRGPIIVAGGPAVTANPLPLYGIVDAFLVGEAEPVLSELARAAQAPAREAALEYLADAGLLVPGLVEKVKRIYARSLDEAWYPVEQRIPPGVEPVWGRAFMLETSRGCGRMCRFCMEGTIFRPKRDRSFPVLKRLLDEGVEVNRVDKVSFYSLSFFDSPHATRILEYAVSREINVSVPSLRAETLTHERAMLIAEGGQRSVTIAPETGSCRLGRAINKCIGAEGALEAIKTAMEAGLTKVKLYLMVGFPGETSEDLEETIKLVDEAALLASKLGGTITVSVNPFMPKPVTAMQWAPLEDARSLREKIAAVSRAAAKRRVRTSKYDPRWAAVQVALARAGPEAARLIVEWARAGASPGAFKRAAAAAGVDVGEYLEGKPPEWEPPWHRVVEHPYASLQALRAEYRAYLAALGLAP